MPILGSIVRDSTFGTALGRGIDGGTGSIRGEPVDFAPPTMSSEGQSSIFHMKQLETVEDITKSFDMSVDGEAQFSMFGGSDKFKFLHEVKVQNYHLYLFVQAIVTNPALILSDVRLKPRAFDLIARDPQRFHEEFGDFFVLGTQTGGSMRPYWTFTPRISPSTTRCPTSFRLRASQGVSPSPPMPRSVWKNACISKRRELK
jgi:hypothetical protein